MSRHGDRKLSLRRETMRRLSSLGREDLARVAGGTDSWAPPDDTERSWTTEWTEPVSFSKTSQFC